MPTKKQRRRREKSFRHEYDFVVEDEEGNEVPVDTTELRAGAVERDKQRSTAKPARTPAKAPRASRAATAVLASGVPARRMMGALMLVAFLFLFKNAPMGVRLAWGIFYAGAFIPLTYFVDRTAYRSYLRRLERSNEKK